ncbi:hypothetical protein EVAR_44786_1 [Eumeta japonica]|uniref:Uncharacterized protein n=1 Tax=Eumeta variegata TaxID=151549 RepID=A0A4C1Y677_EUMVA|nr:hypothetical protein EVAR_44786_1 [Eumeta japonica]
MKDTSERFFSIAESHPITLLSAVVSYKALPPYHFIHRPQNALTNPPDALTFEIPVRPSHTGMLLCLKIKWLRLVPVPIYFICRDDSIKESSIAKSRVVGTPTYVQSTVCYSISHTCGYIGGKTLRLVFRGIINDLSWRGAALANSHPLSKHQKTGR